jgi:type II secretory pathway component GspD/PulD (secretin)
LCRRLCQLADVELVASPNVQVLDRHIAEIAITDDSCREGIWIRPGPRVTDVAGESTLAVKPTIAGQGMIHLEVSQSGGIETSNRRGSRETTGGLTTSVLIPNGGSVVIGEVCQDATATRHSGAGMLGSLRRLLPVHAASTNSSVEFVVVISACIVQ